MSDDALETENKQALETVQTLTAQRDRLRQALIAANHYIAILNRGVAPSHPSYWPATDCYKNAMADLQPGDMGEAAA